jgi:hypothetical protein
MKLLTLISILVVSFIAPLSAQTVITTCGASLGKTYVREGNNGKWVDDGISGGSITLLFDKDKNPDLIIKSRGGSFSAKGDGATVVISHFTEGTISVIAAYPLNTVENYMFKINNNGKGFVMWTSTRSNDYMTTAKAMYADCG